MRETHRSLEADARLRLYPPLTNANWLVLRQRRKIFHRWIGAMNLQQARILDVGGRKQPYRPLFAHCERHYVAIDLRATTLVTVVADGGSLPFASQSFDIALCTQTLQYVQEPRQVLAEIYRVLKPSGVLLLSVPAIYPVDSAIDRWRFLPAGIRELTNNYSRVEVVPEGSSIAGFFRAFNTFLILLATYSPLQALLSYTLVPAINLLGFALEGLCRMNNSAISTNYSVRAQR